MSGGPIDPSHREETQSSVNAAGMRMLIFSMAAAMLFFVYVSFMSGGVDLKEVKEVAPEAAQTVAAAAPEKPVDVSGITEPWIDDERMVAHGKKLYGVNCAACHGAEGKGDGIAGASLNPKPRNLIEGKWKKGGDSIGLFTTLTKGIEGTSMQGYSHMPAKDRWALVQFIRSITTDKVAEKAEDVAKKAASLK